MNVLWITLIAAALLVIVLLAISWRAVIFIFCSLLKGKIPHFAYTDTKGVTHMRCPTCGKAVHVPPRKDGKFEGFTCSSCGEKGTTKRDG